MKNMITMTGKSFRAEVQALQDFTNKRPSHPENAEKIHMVVKRDKMLVNCYSTDGYMLGKFVVNCTDIEKKGDFSFFVSVPPLLPRADEVVKIMVEDNTTLVEYVKSGCMFRTTVKSNSCSFDHESYLDGLMAKPAFRIAVNPKYLKRILLSLIKSNDAVSRDRAPIYMDFTGEDQPIRIFADEGDQRVLLPVRNRRGTEINLKQLLAMADPEPTLRKPGGSSREEVCPNCHHDLKFLHSTMTGTKDVKACPYCGKAIIIKDNEPKTEEPAVETEQKPE